MIAASGDDISHLIFVPLDLNYYGSEAWSEARTPPLLTAHMVSEKIKGFY